MHAICNPLDSTLFYLQCLSSALSLHYSKKAQPSYSSKTEVIFLPLDVEKVMAKVSPVTLSSQDCMLLLFYHIVCALWPF